MTRYAISTYRQFALNAIGDDKFATLFNSLCDKYADAETAEHYSVIRIYRNRDIESVMGTLGIGFVQFAEIVSHYDSRYEMPYRDEYERLNCDTHFSLEFRYDDYKKKYIPTCIVNDYIAIKYLERVSDHFEYLASVSNGFLTDFVSATVDAVKASDWYKELEDDDEERYEVEEVVEQALRYFGSDEDDEQ